MLTLLLALAPPLLFYGTGHPYLFWISASAGIVNLWSFGVMHNFAYGLAKQRHTRLLQNMESERRSDGDIARAKALPVRMTEADAESVPNWITVVNFVATVMVVGLLICGLAIRLL
jgi:hypothetical protein